MKQLFPEQEDLFVLVSLKGKTAKIAVSGGAFTDGQTITLKLGKNLTLVNTATGARYALKLLYVGDAAGSRSRASRRSAGAGAEEVTRPSAQVASQRRR